MINNYNSANSSSNPPPLTEMIDSIVKCMQEKEKAMALSNEELSDKVIKEVWGSLVLGSSRDLLLDEMITRFDKFAGIERDENGMIIAKTKILYEN